jgi:nucleoside phosphorylase
MKTLLWCTLLAIYWPLITGATVALIIFSVMTPHNFVAIGICGGITSTYLIVGTVVIAKEEGLKRFLIKAFTGQY